ncbi:MAG: hypothetical protein IIA44_12580 [Acidobacteria bacterium]|nr:hypothetical protein [Acidobacteriota bacterium]
MVIGHTAQVAPQGVLAEFQVLGTGNADATTVVGRFSADTVAARHYFLKSRAAIGSQAIVQDNDKIGESTYIVDDGVDYVTVAATSFVEVDDGTPAENQVGTAFVWQTATTGGTLTEALRINSSQSTIVSGVLSVDDTTDSTSCGSGWKAMRVLTPFDTL